MGSTSGMWLVLCLIGTAEGSECTDRKPVAAPATLGSGAGKARGPLELALTQPLRSPARLGARWIGQDKQDFVGPHNRLEPSEVQDIHFELTGLDPRREVAFIDVTGEGGDQWQYGVHSSHWKAELRRQKAAPTADLFVEPSRVETGRLFHIVVRYDDDSTAEAYVRGRKADPNLRMPGAALVARWIGQERQDWTGVGPSVGPDGIQDVRINLNRISSKSPVKAIKIEGAGGARWESGQNPRLASNAELILDPQDPSRGDVFFQPQRDLNAQRLKVTVLYENEKSDTATILTSRCDPKLGMPQTPLPRVSERAVAVRWLGQDGATSARPGDVHVTLGGLPTTPAIVAAVLSDSLRGVWVYRASERAPAPAVPDAEPLDLRFSARRTSANLFFPPYRDATGVTFTLSLFAQDGRISLVRFPGGSCDVSKRAPTPNASRALANPGDDVQDLVDRHGTVVLAKGTYRLTHPLVLSRPVTVTASAGATLLFAQPGGDAAWTAAIKVHCGNTTLNGFAVRFEGPVRWNNDVSWGPAVIGMTDNLDQGHDDLKVNVSFTRLDLEAPPIEKADGWSDALRLMRLLRARSGVISANVLRGGPIEFFDGPWQITDNDFRGTLPGTFSHGIFEGHNTHDLQIRGNRAGSPSPSGKTWRFLILTGSSFGDRIERNIIEGIGARDGDTIPWSNEPEVILTEGYRLRYEGRVMALSADGRVLRIGRPQGDAPRTGDVVALLKGPAAGEWSRIVHPLDSSTYLVDPPIPAQTEIVSIGPGFVSQVYAENRIDIRGGRRSDCLVLPGNQFGASVVKNHFLGGAHAFRLSAYPTEQPMIWGWSHTPFLGGVVEGNVLEDAEEGGILGLEHDPKSIKSNQGRTYMTVRLRDNIVRWSESFSSDTGRAGLKEPRAALTIGYAPSHDAAELLVAAERNRLEAPAGKRPRGTLLVRAATYNGQRVFDRRLDLPTGVPANGRDAEAGSSVRRHAARP